MGERGDELGESFLPADKSGDDEAVLHGPELSEVVSRFDFERFFDG